MSNIDNSQIMRLALRMGLPAIIDRPAGYGVIRVIVDGNVFNPLIDARQALQVLKWMQSKGRVELMHNRVILDNAKFADGDTLQEAIVKAALLIR